jgi:uncharacterized protein (TIGR04255 family)
MSDSDRSPQVEPGGTRQGKQYAKPPIDEAVAEFQLEPSAEWDGTVPGKLQGQLSAAYPGKARPQELMTLVSAAAGSPVPFVPQPLIRTLLPNADGTRMVGVSPNLLTVHELDPYRGWDEFSDRIRQALEAYWRVNPPLGVRRVRLRYINRILIPGEQVELDDYFTAAPRVPKGITGGLMNFITRMEIPCEDGSVMVMTLVPMLPRPEHNCAFVLDFDLVWSFTEPVDASRALASIEQLRVRERAAFEAMITDATRRLFS